VSEPGPRTSTFIVGGASDRRFAADSSRSACGVMVPSTRIVSTASEGASFNSAFTAADSDDVI